MISDKSRKRRGHSRYVVLSILILLLLSTFCWFSYDRLSKSRWLVIRKIEVSGNHIIPAEIITNLLAKNIGINILQVSQKDVLRKLSQIKRISQAKIIRIYPHKLKIKISERKGYLYLKSSEGDLFPVDDTGLVLEYSFSSLKEDLPVVNFLVPSSDFHVGKRISTPFITRVIALQKQLEAEKPEFISQISEYYMQNNVIYIIDAKSGTRIILDEKHLQDQLRRYLFVQDNSDFPKNCVVDLRFKNQVIINPEVK